MSQTQWVICISRTQSGCGHTLLQPFRDNPMQSTATYCHTLQPDATHFNMLQHAATNEGGHARVQLRALRVCDKIIQHTATRYHCNTHRWARASISASTSCPWQHTWTHLNTLHHAATRCNTHRWALVSTTARTSRTSRLCTVTNETPLFGAALVSHCNTLHYAATHCSMLQHTATQHLWRTDPVTMQHTVTHCSILQHTAAHCSTLQHTATHFITLQHTVTLDLSRTSPHFLVQYNYATATHCNTLQHTATHCNTLQHKTLDEQNRTHCIILQHNATHTAARCSSLQRTTTCCSTLQLTASVTNKSQLVCAVLVSRCNTLPHTAAHYNTLQHTATH